MNRFVNKYRAKKTNGYPSKKQANRAAELRLMEQAGLIRGLMEEVNYILIPKQGSERAVTYRADFVYRYNDNDVLVVEDTKGFKTKDYIIKRKLMLWVHGIRITEI